MISIVSTDEKPKEILTPNNKDVQQDQRSDQPVKEVHKDRRKNRKIFYKEARLYAAQKKGGTETHYGTTFPRR